PPKFNTVRKKIVKTPAETRVIPIPGKYKTVRVKVATTPATTRTIEIPARYETVSKRVKVTEDKIEWRLVLCETNMTIRNIRSLQAALKAAGYNPGPVDGVIGKQTLKAVDAYQKEENLSRGGITFETVKKLNVNIIK
ncbi:MAG: peptidoglycan-binding protein, partial [Thiotrichaceae bacterium]|nr:peptidoglycan-binding protein [Thiotrichaceae bacterium]